MLQTSRFSLLHSLLMHRQSMAYFRSKGGTEVELKLASIYLRRGLDRNLELVNLELFMGLDRGETLSTAMKVMRSL